ncbi:MAG: hypothetical protein KF861_18070, partial [Planctomycetaceae bacterium]|nr:hypothetical protein [Planctomycetaceae bacterium]
MNELLDILAAAVRDGSLQSLTFSQRTGDSDTQRASVRRVEIGGKPLWQWTRQTTRQQFHENLDSQELIERAALVWGRDFRHAHVFTTHADIAARLDRTGHCRLL